jgi:hypothetical protein
VGFFGGDGVCLSFGSTAGLRAVCNEEHSSAGKLEGMCFSRGQLGMLAASGVQSAYSLVWS